MFSRTLGVSVAFSESFIQFLWKCLSVSLVTQWLLTELIPSGVGLLKLAFKPSL